MTSSFTATIRDRVQQIQAMPAIPAVFLPLLDLLNNSSKEVPVEEVVRLVSYDNTIAAQCLRVASSPLFGLAQAPKSIKGAVMSLGRRRVETILLTCCLGQAFPAKKWVLDPITFWRHSLGCAMVCRKFSEKLGSQDTEKAYMAGLLHDIGFMVNCLVFSTEFAVAMERACREEIPPDAAEQATMGFTHCETGQALAQNWKKCCNSLLLRYLQYTHRDIYVLTLTYIEMFRLEHSAEPGMKAGSLAALSRSRAHFFP
jgi:HD-like signal output (HDOD) protein